MWGPLGGPLWVATTPPKNVTKLKGVAVYATASSRTGIPIHYVVRPEGSHAWGLFESEMRESWNTTVGPALSG